MPRRSLSVFLFVCLLLSAAVASTPKSPPPPRDTPVADEELIPVADFVRPPLFEVPQLNPKGTHFAAVSKDDLHQSRVTICEIATNRTWFTKIGVGSCSWLSNTHLLLNGNQVIDISNPRKLLSIKQAVPTDKRGLMSDTGFFSSYPPRYLPGNARAPEPPEARQPHYWALPANGREGFCIARSDRHTQRRLYRFEDRRWKECPVDLEEITPVAPTGRPGEMYVLGPVIAGQPRALQLLDTVTGTLGAIVYQDAEYDCGPHLIFKRGTTEISGVSVPQSLHRWIWLNDSSRKAHELAVSHFPDAAVVMVNADITDTRFIVAVESDRQPTTYHFVDSSTRSVTLLKPVFSWIDPARMRSMERLTYQARDGIPLEGFLVLPKGADAQHPIPLVVSLHEGPWQTSATWRWDAFTQFLASRGYAVFHPNYRGSRGYDSKIESRDRFDFQKMRDDVTDGVRSLIESGVIDAKRIAVGGFGFGGYLALSAVVDQPDLFRCAYTYGGVFDWDKAFSDNDSTTLSTNGWLQQHIKGHRLVPPSPLKRAGEITVPVFLTRNVSVGDITQESQIHELYVALRRRVECVYFGDLNLQHENEAFLDVVRRCTEMEKFFAKHLVVR